MSEFIVTDQFIGGNIVIQRIDGNQVYLDRDLRDSSHWFYWAFRVDGAAGRTLTFTFPRIFWVTGVRRSAMT